MSCNTPRPGLRCIDICLFVHVRQMSHCCSLTTLARCHYLVAAFCPSDVFFLTKFCPKSTDVITEPFDLLCKSF